jgi:ABC-type multidrug transport system fused ATPase/permease subunit
LLTHPERRRATIMVLGIFLVGVLEFAALSSIMAVVMVITDPQVMETNKAIAGLLRFFPGVSEGQVVLYAVISSAALLIVVAAFNLKISHACEQFGVSIQARMGHQLMKGVLEVPYEWHLSKNKSELVRFFYSDISRWGKDFIMRTLLLSQHAVGMVVPLILLIVMSPLGGVVGVLVVAAIGYGMMSMVRPRLVSAAAQSKDATKAFVRFSDYTVAGVRDLKLACLEANFARRFSIQFERSAQALASSVFWRNVQANSVLLAGQLLLLALAAYLWQSNLSQGQVSAQLALVVVVTFRVVPAFNRFWGLYSSLWNVIPWVEGVVKTHQELAVNLPDEPGPDAITVAADWEELSLEAVSYQYPTAKIPAVAGISLTFRRGGSYGIIGCSGAGKSTLLDIIVCLYRPGEGAVRVDGEDLNQSSIASWRQQIGYVAQSPQIMDGEIWENVALGKEWDEVDEAQLTRALAMANLISYVQGLSEGWHTRVGYQGIAMSGGQRQRLAIARALYLKPTLLILDEATSNLDGIAEVEIQNTLSHLEGEITLIIVAHRISTIQECGEIILLESGSVKDQGDFAELRKRHPDFFSPSGALAQDSGEHED